MSPTPENDRPKENNSSMLKDLLYAVESNPTNNEAGEYKCNGLIRMFQPIKRSNKNAIGYTAKQREILVCTTLKTSNMGQLKRFFTGVRSITEKIIEDEAFLVVREHEGDTQETRRSEECLHFFKYVVLCIRTILDARISERDRQNVGKNTLRMIPQIIDVAISLHEILFSLHACGPNVSSLKMDVINMCETWWLANGENREALIVQCLPLLVLRACEEDDCFTNKTHVQRLFKLREAFHCIDFADSSSDSLRQLILRVASNPLCLKIPDGKKFLASLFQDIHLLKDLHLSFRAQIPEAKPGILQAYGEIYYRAWKEANDGLEHDESRVETSSSTTVRLSIEHEVLQDLMYTTLHVASPGTFQSVLRVLDPVHANKKSSEEASMMYRLYSPILWRSLVAANPKVRRNAVQVLEKVFPIYDPSTRESSMKDAVQMGTDALVNALKDVDPSVRVAASQATGSVCNVFWEALPPVTIRSLLNLVIAEHSSDQTSAAVRAAAIEAVSTILKNNLSHGVLRALLPSIGNLIHDKAEKVRLAVVRLLICIKNVPGIRFYHVVPVDQLLARLVVESECHRNPRNGITKELTALLLNSYLPQRENVTSSLQVKRTMTFLITNPNAAAVFYANLGEHLDLDSMVKFVILLLTCLQSAVNADQAFQVKEAKVTKKRRRSRSTKISNVERDHERPQCSDSSAILTAADTRLMTILSTTIDILWESIGESLEKPSNKAYKKILQDWCDGNELNLVAVLSHFEQMGIESKGNDERRMECFQTCSALLNCAFRLETEASSDLTGLVSASLRNVSSKNTDTFVPLISSYLCFMSSQGKVDELAKALTVSIESSMGDDDFNLMSPSCGENKGRRRSRRGTIQKSHDGIIPTLSSQVAWIVLDGILQGSNQDYVKIRAHILASNVTIRLISESLRKGILLAERILLSSDDSFIASFDKKEIENIVRACEAYGRFALHKLSCQSLKSNDEVVVNSQVEMLLKWTTDIVVPALFGLGRATSVLRDLDLSHISNVSDSLVHLPSYSPSETSPPKQKPNLGRTPEAMRNPTSLYRHHRDDEQKLSVNSIASTLLVSSCMISSELLAMGVSDAKSISTASLGWCNVFNYLNTSWKELLFPCFLRLGVQLHNSSGDYALLERVLLVCNDMFSDKHSKQSKSVREALELMLRNRSQGSEDIVSLFLNISGQLVIGEEFEIQSFQGIEYLADVWMTGGAIPIVLEMIGKNSLTQVCLGTSLSKSLSTNVGRPSELVAFQTNCLSALLRVVDRDIASEIMGKVEFDEFQGEGPVDQFMKRLLETTA